MPNDKIPALDRGLCVIDYLATQPEGLARYAQIKQQFPGITDASLNRLLKALVASEVVVKRLEGGYRLTSRVRNWSSDFKSLSWLDKARQHVTWLVKHYEESAGCVVLREDKLEVVCSMAQVEGVHIMVPGATLHFEADHAAALATLSGLDDGSWRPLVKSDYSRDGEQIFEAAFSTCRLDNGCYRDKSTARPGICRVARPVVFAERDMALRGAFFFCLTEVQCDVKLDGLCEGLQRVCQKY